MIGKYQDAIPFYRMEKILERYELQVSRATLCNLAIGVGRALSPLIERMWQDARAAPVILMDETRLQVLKEKGRSPESQSFMWVTLGMDREKKVILYHYHPTRSGDVLRKALEGYRGYLQTDGYGGYNAIPGVKYVFCFAHMRRKFVEAEKIGCKRSILPVWLCRPVRHESRPIRIRLGKGKGIEQAFQILQGLHAVCLGGLDDAVDPRARVRATRRVGEEPVLPAHHEGTDRVLHTVRARRQERMIDEARGQVQMIRRIRDRMP
jgi:hypothetical protein